MVRDDSQNSRRRKAVAEHWQGTLQAIQFVIHRNAYGLKGWRKVSGSGACTERSAYGANQVIASVDGSLLASPHDCPREAARTRFVPILAEQLREFGLVKFG